MKCEIISIGSELTSGQNLDTNSQWLSRRLAEIGIAVGWHTTIADDLDANVDAFRIAAGRAGLVLVTGGLGPTQDDLTREALARAAGVELVFDQELAATRSRRCSAAAAGTMPERNRVQALLPRRRRADPQRLRHRAGRLDAAGRRRVAAMPGVPSEMFAMFEKQVRPRLLALGLGGGVLVQRKINTFGAGESAVEEKLLDLTRRGHVPEVGITVSDATISLRILARAADRPRRRPRSTRSSAPSANGSANWSSASRTRSCTTPSPPCWRRSGRRWRRRRASRPGWWRERLAQRAGRERWLRGGVVAYDNRLKVELLGVPQSLLDDKGAVSAEVAEAMAVGCRTRLRDRPGRQHGRRGGAGRPGAGQAGRPGLRRPGLGRRRRRRRASAGPARRPRCSGGRPSWR